jgi:hypothetical protein
MQTQAGLSTVDSSIRAAVRGTFDQHRGTSRKDADRLIKRFEWLEFPLQPHDDP